MKVAFVKDGLYKCINKGCLKAYAPSESEATCCKHHPGDPIFRDTRKYWTCCKKETWDWDEFVKLPTCQEGTHSPKMV